MDLRESFRLFIQAKQVSNRGARTIDWYTQQVTPWLVWIEQSAPDDVFDPDLFEQFLASEKRRANLGAAGVLARYKAVRAFLNWLHQRERRRLRRDKLDPEWEPPTSLIDKPEIPKTKPRVADSDDLERLLASIRVRTWVDARDRCLLEALRSCGLRVEEACSLKPEHVDVRERFVFVAGGKGEKDRYVPFGERFSSVYTAYLFARPATSCPHLFVAATGHQNVVHERLNSNAVRKMLRRRCKAAGVAYINPHSIRHLYAIESLNRGMQASAVSAAMGHTSVSFTLKLYAKWVKSGLRREYDENVKR